MAAAYPLPLKNNASRTMLEATLCLGRTLITETTTYLQYKATRDGAPEHTGFYAHFYQELCKTTTIDRTEWNTAAPILDDACHLLLQLLEHLIGLAPINAVCISERNKVIQQANDLLHDLNLAIAPHLEENANETIAGHARTHLLSTLKTSLHELITTVLTKQCAIRYGKAVAEIVAPFDAEADEGINNAIFYSSRAALKMICRPGKNDEQYCTEYVADNDSSGRLVLFLNVACPTYLPLPPQNPDDVLVQDFSCPDFVAWKKANHPHTEANEKEWESYCTNLQRTKISQDNQKMFEMLFRTIIDPLCIFTDVDATTRHAAEVVTINERKSSRHLLDLAPLEFHAVEFLLLCLVDMYTKHIIPHFIVRRYTENLLAILSALHVALFPLAASLSMFTAVSEFRFYCREMCYLLPLTAYHYLISPELDYTGVPTSNAGALTLDELQAKTGRKFLHIADLPSNVVAIPIIVATGESPSSGYEHCSKNTAFAQIIQGMDNRVLVPDILNYQVLNLDPSLIGRSSKYHIPTILDSSYQALIRLFSSTPTIDNESGIGESSSTVIPSFIKTLVAKHDKAAQWHAQLNLAIPKKQLKLFSSPERGVGSTVRLFGDELYTHLAEDFYVHFVTLLETMMELFSGNTKLYETYAACKELVSDLVGNDNSRNQKMGLVSGFYGAVKDIHAAVAQYCTLLRVIRKVDDTVEAAFLKHTSNKAMQFQARLMASSLSDPNDRSPSPVDEEWDSEKIVVFEWDDMTLNDTPAQIVAERNGLRANISLSFVASRIDQIMSTDPTLSMANIDLKLAFCLNALAIREIQQEDASNNAMNELHDVYNEWIKLQTAPFELNVWLGFVLTPSLAADHSLHDMPWFTHHLYKRQIWIDSWYILDPPGPVEVGQLTNQPELSFNAKICAKHHIRLAPQTDKRRPCLLNNNGPLSIVLRILNDVSNTAVQFGKVYLDSKLVRTFERVFNTYPGLVEHTEQKYLTMPELISQDEHGNPIKIWSDTLQGDILGGDEDDETSAGRSGAFSLFRDVGLAITCDYQSVIQAMDTFGHEQKLDTIEVFIRCLRMIVENMLSTSVTRMFTALAFEKRRLFHAWTSYREAIAYMKTESPQEMMESLTGRIRVIEMNRMLYPPALLQYMACHFGDFSGGLEDAKSTKQLKALLQKKVLQEFQDMLKMFLKSMGQKVAMPSEAELDAIFSSKMDDAENRGLDIKQILGHFLDALC